VRIEKGQPVPEYRVTALHYRFVSDEDQDRFDQSAVQSGSLGPFTYRLEDLRLTAFPTQEFLDLGAAKATIEVFLRAWEQDAYLGTLGHRIRFEYERSHVEEVNPVPGFVFAFAEEAMGTGSANAAAVVSRNNASYPSPDPRFIRTPITDRLTERLRRVRDRESELPAAAYFVLDTHEFGGPKGMRANAAKALSVDRAVLDAVGRLSSRADPDLGRKGGGDKTPLTGRETTWLCAAMIRLIRRAGEYVGCGPLSVITLADLPPMS
jgi:hypothetical protein